MEDDTPLRIRVDKDNRITIPEAARSAVGITAGDSVIIEVRDGAMVVTRDIEDHVAQ